MYIKFVDMLSAFWWEYLPCGISRLASKLGKQLSNGYYFTAFPDLAAWTPLLALVLGVVCGWYRFGAADVFTESWLILILAIVFGSFSSLHGALFVTGFAIVDFFFYQHPTIYRDTLQVRFALIIVYTAFLYLAAVIPATARALCNTVPLPSPKTGDLRFIAEMMLTGLIAGVFVYLYLQALPLIIRPPFTWGNERPPVSAMILLQEHTWIFAAVAFIAGVVRVFFEYASILSTYGLSAAPDTDTSEEEQPIRTSIITALGMTLLLAGMVDNMLNIAILFIALVLVMILRIFGVRFVPIWPQLMEKIPLLMRVVGALVLVYFVSSVMLPPLYNNSENDSFLPLLLTLIPAALIMAIVFPPHYNQPTNEKTR